MIFSRTTVKTRRGFTLLELIVSVGLFSIIMLIVTSAYLTMVDLDRKARATSDVMTNLSFVVESMGREIRTGTNYRCSTNGTTFSDITPNCINGGTAFKYTDSRGWIITYSLVAPAGKGQVMITVDNGSTAVTSPLTDTRVDVNRLDFYVRGIGKSSPDTYLSPQVSFVIQGEVQSQPGDIVEFSLQSSATQRYLELI
jgi:prepilin-type N-terminal cleavage/methylation domain-containing protein